jgi:hypothetical protein|tara:strand:+ start:663 stop:1085 length:423 start_codon:yes stop_codon:yes gene_type:complete
MKELTIGGTATATLLGAWELRAGSQDTTEWLDGAADTTYPGGGPGTFSAVNSDGANGYDPAPKMALISLTGVADNETVILGGGISSIYSVFIQENDATPVNDAHASNNMALDVSRSGTTITLHVVGGASDIIADLMVMYS